MLYSRPQMKKRQLQPGSAPTSSISAQTGWKPILHYAVASSRVGSEKMLSGALEASLDAPKGNDRGRESECSPSLRTGQAVFQRPALQLMGSTVRLRASRFRDRLLALSALYASCGQVERPGLVKEASSFDPCFQGPQHRI